MNPRDASAGSAGSPPPEPGPKPDPRPGMNPGYDDANPDSREDVPRRQPDARGENFGKLRNPEAGGLERDPVARPDPAADGP